MTRILAVAALALAALPLAGCFGSGGSDGFDFTPGGKFKETGRTVHLKATVVDFDQVPYPGFSAWLWAFCFEPVDPNDAYSANAIEGFTLLPGDQPVGASPNAKCSVPGPTLRVKQGDRVKVEFSHSHFHPHTIHWHGQFVPWESDGAPGVSQDSVESGGAFTYDFVAKRAGTLWYHCHVDTQFHVQQGLYGMIIVEPQDTKYEPKGIDREYVLVLSTMNRNTVEAVGTTRHSHPPGCASGFPGCENPPSIAGKADVFLINGHSYPTTMEQPESLVVVKQGERVRLRILNAGETVEELHPHGHDMQVVAKDGNPLAPGARYFADTLAIGPAERYDVVITADNPGPWMIHTHVNSHETNCGKAPGGMHTMLVYEEYLDRMHQFRAERPAECPFGSVVELPGDSTNQTTVAFGTVAQQAPEEAWRFPIELVCGVRSITFRADLRSGAPPTPLPAPLTTVTLSLRDTLGTEVLSQPLTTESPEALYVLEKERLTDLNGLPEGNYTATLSTAQSVEASVELFAHVDYYETFEQSKVGHLTYKSPGCIGFT